MRARACTPPGVLLESAISNASKVRFDAVQMLPLSQCMHTLSTNTPQQDAAENNIAPAHLSHKACGADHCEAAVVNLLGLHLVELIRVLRADAQRVKPAAHPRDEHQRRCSQLALERSHGCAMSSSCTASSALAPRQSSAQTDGQQAQQTTAELQRHRAVPTHTERHPAATHTHCLQ